MFLSSSQRWRPACHFRPTVENLENRLTPAITTPLTATPAGTLGTFTDADNDVVTVIVRGTSGVATFTDSNGDPGVADGTNIATISVANASADFSLTFLDDSNATGGNNVVLGEITVLNNRLIRGIYSVDPDGGDTNFELTTFKGKGLSAKGSIVVDNVVGNLAGLGIDIVSLGGGRSIDVDDDVVGDVLIRKDFGGSIQVGGNAISGDLTIQRNWLKGGLVNHLGALADWTGDVSVAGLLSGEVLANGEISGTWKVTGAVTASARLVAGGSWADLDFDGNFGGQMFAGGGFTDMDILKNIAATARLTAANNSNIFVQKNIRTGSIINIGGAAATLDIDVFAGSIGGTISALNDLDVTLVFGSVLKTASLSAGGDTTINLASGNFAGRVTAFSLDFRVSNGSVTKTAVIQSVFVQDGPDTPDSFTGFFVGGNFAGLLEVTGIFSSGSGLSTTIIGGTITATARLTIASPLGGAAEYVFCNRLEGQLTLLGDLMTNIAINGAVAGPASGIKIFGQVLGLANINVVGRLSFLSSFSGFNAATGEFVTSDGMVTGTLTVGGTRGPVLPQI